MKTRSKTLVCLLLGVMMLLSLIGAGVFAMAEDVVGKQASFPAEAFDTNGWLTSEYFNALEDKTGVIAAGEAAVTRHPEAATGGYTYINAHSQQKYLNYNKFEIGDEIALEYLMQLSPKNDHGPRLFHLVDSASADGYLGLSETKTKFALFFNEKANRVQVFVDGKQQTLANGGGAMAIAADNLKTIWAGAPDMVAHYVSIALGADSIDVKIDNVTIGSFAVDAATVFPSGKVQLVVDFWLGGDCAWNAFSPFDPFAIFQSSVPNSFNFMAKSNKDDIVLNLTQPVKEITVSKAAGGTDTLVKDTDYTADGGKVTIKNATLTGKETDYYGLNTTFTLTAEDDRTTTFVLNVLYVNPPALKDEQMTPLMVDGTLENDVTFGITYEREETYTVTVDGAALSAENGGAAWADETITVTLKKDFVNGLKQGPHTVTVGTAAGAVNYQIFRKTAQDEWVNAETMDPKAEGTASDGQAESVTAGSNGSTTMHMGMLSRVYYSELLDLSKTVYLELDINQLELGTGHGWFVIGMTSNPAQLASFSESATDTYFAFLYDHTKGEFQCPGDAAKLPTQSKPEYVNQNGAQLFAFTFNQTGTIVTYNGFEIWNTDKWTIDSFTDGKAYIGIFSGTGTLDITTRTDPASPVANTYGLEYELGTENDVVFPMYNTAAVSAIKYGGEELGSSDWAFADGKVTIKSSFLKTVAYADVLRFTVVADGGVEVKANVKALCEVNAEKSLVGTVGTDGAVYSKAFAGKTVTTVVDMATNETLTADEDYTVAEDGTITLAKELFDAAGTYSYAVVADNELSFLMAIHQTYTDGWASQDGKSNGSVSGGALAVKGESKYLREELVDLSKGAVAFTLDIDKINGYYKSGLDGSTDAHIDISLYDMFSGNTVTLAVYANDSEDSGSYLGYFVLSIRDKNGNRVFVNNTAIADSTNFTDAGVIGENYVEIGMSGNTLTVTFNDDVFYLDIGTTTVLTHLQLGVASTADIGDAKNEFSIAPCAVREPSTDPDPSDPSDPSDPTDPVGPGTSGGCGGCNGSAVGTAGTVLAVAIAAGALFALTLGRKKKD